MRKHPVLRVILSSMKLQFKQSFSRSMYRFVIIVAPIFTGLLLGLIYYGRSAEDFVSYVMIGTATTTMWSSISFSSAGDIERERYMGALAQIFNTPESFYFIMLGKIIGNTIMGSLSMICSFIYVSLLFSVPIVIKSMTGFVISSILGILSYMLIAQMLSGVLAISRETRTIMNSMDFPVYILTGAVFPIGILPFFLRPFSYLLSPTYAIHLMRLSVAGKAWTHEFWMYMSGLIVMTAIYGFFSVYIYRVIEKKARENATLEVV